MIKFKTIIGKSGNYEEMQLSDALDIMTDEWIDNNITMENVSELRDCCKILIKELEKHEVIG